ncbi:MAG: hypothetical protein JWO12_530 [Frankiales bacterium]|nr:hypothetical protein [Frankiales bacterium]
MRALVVPVLVLPLLAGCTDAVGCRPTTMHAEDAKKVQVNVAGASVLRARLTTKGAALAGKDVTFTLRAGDSDVYRGTSATRADGSAALDLKGKLDAQAVLGLARADGFTASFSGDATYCSSADDGSFTLV